MVIGRRVGPARHGTSWLLGATGRGRHRNLLFAELALAVGAYPPVQGEDSGHLSALRASFLCLDATRLASRRASGACPRTDAPIYCRCQMPALVAAELGIRDDDFLGKPLLQAAVK